jgi:hypothetical protein
LGDRHFRSFDLFGLELDALAVPVLLGGGSEVRQFDRHELAEALGLAGSPRLRRTGGR